MIRLANDLACIVYPYVVRHSNVRKRLYKSRITHDTLQARSSYIFVDLVRIWELVLTNKYNVYLIFKEAINNISKYAGCRNVIIRMERQGSKRWMMEISDDGNGFETSFVNSNEMNLSGNGIRNMRKRAEEVNGTFNVVSSPGKGVKVQVSFIL